MNRQPGNIVGIRVDKKNVRGTDRPYYAIIFHVVRKVPSAELTKKQLLPKFFLIRFPDGKIKKIKSDVEETGSFSFQTSLPGQIINDSVREAGTMGLIVTDTITAYGVTNYHVAAKRLLNNDHYYYYQGSGYTPDSLYMNGTAVTLDEGIFTNELDVAFVNLGDAEAYNNALPDGNTLTRLFVEGPITTDWRGSTAFVYSQGYNGHSVFIKDTAVIFDPHFRGYLMLDMIMVERCTDPGDSGSLIVTDNFDVLGILIGADDSYSYFIPYYKIFKLKKLPIL